MGLQAEKKGTFRKANCIERLVTQKLSKLCKILISTKLILQITAVLKAHICHCLTQNMEV